MVVPLGETAVCGQKTTLRLSPARFCCAWVAVAALRCLCALFHFSATYLYTLLSSHELAWYVNFFSPNAGELFPSAALLFKLLGVAHVVELALMIAHLVGDSHERFKLQFLLREAIEMASQTLQAYQSNALIARAWINHIYVAALFVNSWSTPVVERLTRRSEPLERVSCLAVDLLLDALMSIMLPVLIVLPHTREFDSSTMTFDVTVMYTLRDFNRIVMESRQVFAHDWIDLVLKLIPHLSILGCLRNIQALLVRAPVRIVHSTQNGRAPAAKTGPRKRATPDASFAAGRAHRTFRRRRWIMLFHGVFVLWGWCILCVHLEAASGWRGGHAALDAGCMQKLHPWLTKKTACSIYKYDCAEHGTTTPSEDSLAFLDEWSLVQLVIANCPALTMPSTIQRFRALLGIDIWSSSIADWGVHAALTHSHTAMVYLGFLETNMSSIPPGILLDLPPQLRDIEITHSNLTTLPEDLHERWSHVETLFVEFSGLERVPDALTKMQFYDLSLIGNRLTDVEVLQQSTSGFHALLLSRNPLRVLPAAPIRAEILAIDFTDVESSPSWISSENDGPAVVYAFGTPLCATEESQARETSVTCADVNFDKDGRYPVALVKALNAA